MRVSFTEHRAFCHDAQISSIAIFLSAQKGTLMMIMSDGLDNILLNLRASSVAHPRFFVDAPQQESSSPAK